MNEYMMEKIIEIRFLNKGCSFGQFSFYTS